MTSDPVLAAARRILADSLDEMRKAIAGLSTDGLNWRPGIDTNSLAALAMHSLSSARSYVNLAFALPPPARDRDSEFVFVSQDVAALSRWIEGITGDILGAIDDATDFLPDRNLNDGIEDITAGWALLHAVEHVREHVGQMMLTRQLWEQNSERKPS